MTVALYAFPEDADPASGLAAAFGCPLAPITPHQFPDGETRPTVGQATSTALLYRSLARPDPKLMPLLLAADALRRGGARRVVLVAPYMPYLRQDRVFSPGEPLSRDVFGRFIGQAFERIVTVEPHLHRTTSLDLVFAGASVTALSATPVFATALEGRAPSLIVGPDVESAGWTAELARRLGADHMTFTKQRLGDQAVKLAAAGADDLKARSVALVDDICASGATLETAIHELRRRGAGRIEVLVCHALFDAAAEARLRAAGAAAILSTDSCAHPTNAIPLASLLAGALTEELTE